MTSTIINNQELLNRGWDHDPIRDSFKIDGGDFVLRYLSVEPTPELIGRRWYLEFPGGVVYMSTIEQLYSHLHHFGLIEPESITAEGLLVMGFEKEPAHDKDAGISTYRLKNVKVLINIADEEFLFAYYKEFMTLVDTMQDLRDLCRLMGINNTPPNGGEGGTNA